jgi:hypothetical protein
MSSSEQARHLLILEALEPGLDIMVIDAEGAVVGREASNGRRLEFPLPRGLYTVRATRGGAFTEQVVRHNDEQVIQPAPPALYSAATIPQAHTTHEYYTEPAWEMSQNPTTADLTWNGDATAQLLLFARAPRDDLYRGEDQFSALSLYSLGGSLLSSLSSEAARQPTGWTAFSARVSPGVLILQDSGLDPDAWARQMPIPLFSGWQTQLFVMHNGRLLWEDMRLNTVSLDEIDSRRYRNPYDDHAIDIRSAKDMDVGLLALQNNTPSIAPHLLDAYLNAKFQNPMLGLLGAYLMLMQYSRVKEDVDRDRIRLVLGNLKQLLPDSADVVALQVMAQRWVELPFDAPVTGIPLFRIGTEALLGSAASNAALLTEGSLLDVVSDDIYGDTVWTSWSPVSLPVGQHVRTTVGTPIIAPSWVELAIVDAVSAAERRDAPPTPDEMMRQIGVSPRAVRDAMDSLMIRAATSTIGTEPFADGEAYERDLRRLGSSAAQSLANAVGSGFNSVVWSENLGMTRGGRLKHPDAIEVFDSLRRTLTDFASEQAENLSEDTRIVEILKPDDTQGRHHARQRLLREFRDANLQLSAEDIESADTVKDLANLIQSKFAE